MVAAFYISYKFTSLLKELVMIIHIRSKLLKIFIQMATDREMGRGEYIDKLFINGGVSIVVVFFRWLLAGNFTSWKNFQIGFQLVSDFLSMLT